jgi:hypothetical protein
MHPEAMTNAPLTDNNYLWKFNRILVHFIYTGITVHTKDYDKEIPPWRKEDELPRGLEPLGFKKSGNRLLRKLHSLEYTAKLISAYASFTPIPPAPPYPYGQLVHQQLVDMRRRLPTQESWVNQIYVWKGELCRPLQPLSPVLSVARSLERR